LWSVMETVEFGYLAERMRENNKKYEFIDE
jgi:hypothetical protein